ncbi:MAG: GNAT family N-acetyltransferase, partial [Abitibacteriaceae bacterium]|nr:GNAT family N-acetyltransferase [Abditibacteriaceae bacterium]
MSTEPLVLSQRLPGASLGAASRSRSGSAPLDLTTSGAGLLICSGHYSAHVINGTDEKEVRRYQALRYESFVVRKGWVTADPNHPGCEMDRYDPYCHHLGVFLGSHLSAYLRALPWQPHLGFMLEHEFRDLLPETAASGLSQEGVVEISRLVIAPLPDGG